MKNRSRWIAAFFLVLNLGFRAEAAGPIETLGFSFKADAARSRVDVNVLDETTGAAIPDAVTRMSGAEAKTVWIHKDGYGDVLLVGVPDGELTVYMKPIGVLGLGEVVTGEPKNYLPFQKNFVETGLVIRALGVSDLVSLNISSLLSPLKDTIDLFGSRMLPSNLAIPFQKVNVLITLSKPTYRLPMSGVRRSRLSVVHASIPLVKLADLPREPTAEQYVNLLTPKKAGWTDAFLPKATVKVNPSLSVDLPTARDVSMEGTPVVGSYYGMGLIDLASDRQAMIATDVKSSPITRAGSAKIRIMTPATLPAGGKFFPVAAAISDNGKLITATILDGAPSTTVAKFLTPPPLMDGPLPELQTVAPNPKSYSVVTLHEKTAMTGNRSVQVVVFPSAAETKLPLKDVMAMTELKAVRWTLSQLEMGDGFDPKNVSAAMLPTLLKRFTFSLSDIR